MSRSMVPWRRKGETAAVARGSDDPFVVLHRRMNDLFDEVFQDFGFGPLMTAPGFRRGHPALFNVDVVETDDEVRVTADLPGMEEKDVEVNLDRDVLTLRGTRREEHEEKNRNYHLLERSHGEFHRQIPVPPGLDLEKVGARFKNGVLTVTLPKKPEAKSAARKIEVSRA